MNSKTSKISSVSFVYGWLVGKLGISSPQPDNFGLSGPQSGRGAGRGARACNREVPADLRVGTLSTMPPMSPFAQGIVRSNFSYPLSKNLIQKTL
ncbi:hypothetical protein PoB_002330000 [Plakobranchus ocellatus]|uniref:Uncharacterized protein n=1 Tax=Plakobranchus ocellatus TaxID=259542 RepID=A0AAV3ZNR7_9GAST|nr:hypothetical protein PoB_002330000 [Plakobranchus ocellatus]